MNYNPTATCGHCGQDFEQHEFDTDRFGDLVVYCYNNTNGDLWDDEPSSEYFVDFMENTYPHTYKMLIRAWQRLNGHKEWFMENKEQNFVEGLIHDTRLTPDLKRLRNGEMMEFYTKDDKDKKNKICIKAPRQELYAELIDDVWYWVNGCSKCRGVKKKWAYATCYEHDRCEYCNIHRSKLKESPWGHEYGFVCQPCEAVRKARDKQAALEKVAKSDYICQNEITCPHCATVIKEDQPKDYNGLTKICECCGGKFSIEMKISITYSTVVVGDRLLPERE